MRKAFLIAVHDSIDTGSSILATWKVLGLDYKRCETNFSFNVFITWENIEFENCIRSRHFSRGVDLFQYPRFQYFVIFLGLPSIVWELLLVPASYTLPASPGSTSFPFSSWTAIKYYHSETAFFLSKQCVHCIASYFLLCYLLFVILILS